MSILYNEYVKADNTDAIIILIIGIVILIVLGIINHVFHNGGPDNNDGPCGGPCGWG